MGKAVKMAKTKVNKGTRAKIVVNVSELAVVPKRTSRNRVHKVLSIWRQGN